MHVHLPKPLHGWRAFVGEVGIIVIGVLIALGAEQIVEAVHWRHKVEATKTAIDTELGDDLRWALMVQQYAPCAQAYLAKYEAAVVTGDTSTIRKLLDLSPEISPFPAAAWSQGTFLAALSSQVEDHLPEGRMAAYSREFTWVPLEMQYQFKIYDEFATAKAAGLGLGRSPDIVERQIEAVERLHSDQNGRLAIAESMLEFAHAHRLAEPSNPTFIALNKTQAAQCAAEVSRIGPQA